MAKTGGLGDRLLVDGLDLSGDVGAIDSISGGPAPLDFTRLSKPAVERIGGRYDAALTWTSYFNPTGAHLGLSTLPTSSRVVTYLRGGSLGYPGAGLLAKQIGYDGKRGSDGAFTLAVAAQGSHGIPLEWGEQGTPGIRTDTSAANGASLDHGAATSAGLSAYLHLLAFTGTSVTVKVQHSTDDATWADLASFTTLSDVGAERIETAGTVNRYLRVITTGTFTVATTAVVLCRDGAGSTVDDPYSATYTSTY